MFKLPHDINFGNMNEKSGQEWHAITVTAPRGGADWISHCLFELGSLGNIEEDHPDPALIAMKGYFPTELGPVNAVTQAILEFLRKGFKVEPISTYATTIKIQNWAEKARQDFSPVKILKDVTVIPPWQKYRPAEDEKIVIINPGMAFGTGLHASTQLTAGLMGEVIRAGNCTNLLDVGCGSGILTIIAAKLGVLNLCGVEIDDDARITARENIRRNISGDGIKLHKRIDEVGRSYDLIVANILFSIIVELMPALIKRIAAGGQLVVSGITTDEDGAFKRVCKKYPLELVKEIEQEGWMGYRLRVKGDR